MVKSQVSAGSEPGAQWASVHHAHNSQGWTHCHRRKGKSVSNVNFLNSLIIHQVLTKEIMTVTVFGYLILMSIDFYDFNSQLSP